MQYCLKHDSFNYIYNNILDIIRCVGEENYGRINRYYSTIEKIAIR
jgi:hypothetical protein